MISLPRTNYFSPMRGAQMNQELTTKLLRERMPDVMTRIDKTGQSLNIVTATAYMTSANEFGLYLVNASLITSHAGVAGTATVMIGWHNGSGANSATSPAVNLTILGDEVVLSQHFTCGANQSITYSVILAGAVGAKYDVHIRLTYLQ